jgi:hypothetical protein
MRSIALSSIWDPNSIIKEVNHRVITVISAASIQEARKKAWAMNPDYAVVAIPPKVGVCTQESGRSYAVELREAPQPLGWFRTWLLTL